MPSSRDVGTEEAKVPLLEDSASIEPIKEEQRREWKEDEALSTRVWNESKNLWQIVGPGIFSRVSTYSMFVISQAFAGHLGDLELAAMSIASNVILATPILKLLGQPSDVAELSGQVALYFIPLHFCFAVQFPIQRFLQSQVKNRVIAWTALLVLVVHVFLSWLFVYKLKYGLLATILILNFSWWLLVVTLLVYIFCGGCPLTWTGFSMEAFSGLWDFLKLSAASGVMLCLENWYYRILIVMTGNLENAKIEVDALSICMSINGWEMMIPLGFFAGTGVRVANELGAGNGRGAKFAVIVSVTTSIIIGLFFWLLIMIFHNELALMFSTSKPVLKEGIWAGMIFGGTAVQTVILAIITMRCEWEKEAEKANVRVRKWSTRMQEH
ncbi:hypothetical protein FEM48_Zijuj08G0148200 [Ziziphus jujuba var. spinosa]|uniref:Protein DETOXIFICATION 27-like n=1 Tax=Ziziphus jujuba var. spinosa TaxID=714518 RepID=A0A978UZR3_ZIZJJ|nr:hypothetical protein FEM48_Zijuj08G0148200 [Ziziphus jujuba var. spinosa]